MPQSYKQKPGATTKHRNGPPWDCIGEDLTIGTLSVFATATVNSAT